MGVVDLVVSGGTVFVGSDVFFLSDDSFSKKVYKTISNYERMEEIHSNYQSEYGFRLGDYGLYSLSQKLNIINEKWLLWGKTQNNAYAVKLCIMKKM